MSRHEREPGYVYLLRLEQDADPYKCAYKIGKSATPTIRRSQLGIVMPYKLTLVHVIETDQMTWTEQVMHQSYENERLEGEWFTMDAEGVQAFCDQRVINFLDDDLPF